MIHVDMSAPATLCRTNNASVRTRPGKSREAIAVAQGPFVIMAHGYLAQSLADRPTFWIRSEQRNVMPAEIEESMRRWSNPDNGIVAAAR